jgi:5-methylcytosine-specific restriction endonuclease McrA
MTKEEYRELRRDGRWQRKRLEIMQRDDFKCRQCGTTNDLNVHHIRYIEGRLPWEYDNGDLVTLC